MVDAAPLADALRRVVAGVRAAGGVAEYLDMNVGVNDGCRKHPGVEGNRLMREQALQPLAKFLSWPIFDRR